MVIFMMTEFELREIAGRKGYVRWTRSGIVERLKISKNDVFAGRFHMVDGPTGETTVMKYHRIRFRDLFLAEEIDPKTPVPITALIKLRP